MKRILIIRLSSCHGKKNNVLNIDWSVRIKSQPDLDPFYEGRASKWSIVVDSFDSRRFRTIVALKDLQQFMTIISKAVILNRIPTIKQERVCITSVSHDSTVICNDKMENAFRFLWLSQRFTWQPCITFVQYIGGYSVHREISWVQWRNIMEGYLSTFERAQHIGRGIHEHIVV